jgi:hypothetical protein
MFGQNQSHGVTPARAIARLAIAICGKSDRVELCLMNR